MNVEQHVLYIFLNTRIQRHQTHFLCAHPIGMFVVEPVVKVGILRRALLQDKNEGFSNDYENCTGCTAFNQFVRTGQSVSADGIQGSREASEWTM